MKDYFLRFPTHTAALLVFRELGMTVTQDEHLRDANGELVYTIEQKPAYNWDYYEDGTPNFSPQLDADGNPIMEDSEEPVYGPVEHICRGSHQYALDLVGEIPGKEGYHINLRVIDPEFDVSAMEPYQVFPQQPVRVWA